MLFGEEKAVLGIPAMVVKKLGIGDGLPVN